MFAALQVFEGDIVRSNKASACTSLDLANRF